jgi:hypothetical protein
MIEAANDCLSWPIEDVEVLNRGAFCGAAPGCGDIGPAFIPFIRLDSARTSSLDARSDRGIIDLPRELRTY